MKKSGRPKSKKPVKIGKRCYIGEHAVPSVKWLVNAKCPRCGGTDLMDAHSMALCIKCNKFVKPRKA